MSVPIHDDASGFAIELAPPNAVVCVVEPSALYDATACKGIDVDSIRKEIAKGQTAQKVAVGMAVVRHEGWAYQTMILRQTYGGAGSMTPKRIEAWLRAAKQGVHDQLHRDVEATAVDGAAFAPTVMNDMNVLAIVIQPSGPDAPPLRIVSWSFVADDRIATVTFFTDPTHLDAVREEAKSIVATVSWPEARASRARGKFGRSPSGSGFWVQAGVAVAVLAVVVVAITLLRRRKRTSRGA